MPKYRKKIIAGNWKMNKSVSESVSLAEGVKRDLSECRDVDVVLCPTFTSLKSVGDVIDNTSVRLGAQNMHWEINGAYTGEISPTMLRDVFCQYVILGHSERRGYFNETDDNVNKKAKVAIESRMTPIVCVGETLDERDAGDAERIVRKQVELSLADMGEGLSKVVVAYEPVWA
ncbi:MAG: triosephosphate isomerase, partial [Kiritimatiellae bacterium]|nr:triosephosphate isomerase [Kiritimatiellia bacterium]